MALIERADLPLRPGEWWVMRIVALVVGRGCLHAAAHGGLGHDPCRPFIGLVARLVHARLVLRFLAKRPGQEVRPPVPDVLTLIASSLSTGFSLPQALDAVAKDAAEPAAKEFSRALAETRIGTDIAEALERLSDRMDSDNMRWTSMAIRIQREVGGNLAETMRTTAKTLREREELGPARPQALSAEGKLSAYILIALPIGIFLFTDEVQPGVHRGALDPPHRNGHARGGDRLTGIGYAWMRKVVDVKV